MKIRLENKDDYYNVEYLTREAFWNVYRPGCFEHYVIHQLRNSDSFIPSLDYVIEENGEIVGNIVYSLGKLELENGRTIDMLTFGPLSVKINCRGKGYAFKLIEYTLEKAKSMGYKAVVITGDPAYYKKYGFVSASDYGIYYKGLSKTDSAPYFMIKILDDNFNESGYYSDPDVFNVDEEDLSKYDEMFPIWPKEKREGQLE